MPTNGIIHAMDWSNLLILDSASYSLAQNIFLRALGLIYFVAFSSLLVEILALYGKNGVSPIVVFLKSRRVISVFRLCSHDYFIWTLCFLGLPLSILLILGIQTPFCLLLLLFIYLSFVVVGQNFLAFQWDALLIEVSFIAFFFSLSVPASPFLLIALWFLLFRFMLSSGFVKLISGDISWRNLTALKYHYETQPLPNRTAWYLHQLPPLFHQITACLMFGIELIIPFLILGPNELKLIAFAGIVGLQVSLIFSGNFSFLNYLTIVLCLPLLMNVDLIWLEPYFIVTPQNNSIWLSYFLDGVGIFFIIANILQFLRLLLSSKWISGFFHWLSPTHITRPYGLFAVMTKTRTELVIQGSRDGQTWHSYEFKYKVQNLYHSPPQIAPFHPRLDWQMWFAALQSQHQVEPWLRRLLHALLLGSKSVLRMMKKNPFSENPPRYVRVDVYEYRFCDLKTHQQTGQWWERKLMAIGEPLELVVD